MTPDSPFEPFTTALTPSISLDALLARREALRASIRTIQAAYLEMHARRRALFDGDASGTGTDYDLGLRWYRTGREMDDPGHTDGVDLAFKRVDAACWAHMLARSGMEQLMDQVTRAAWRKDLEDLVMPEFTQANVEATYTKMGSERGEIFERGIVNIFRKLSHDYKTNTPVKLGKRLIVTYAAERQVWHHNDKHPNPALRGRAYVQVYGPRHEFADKLDDLIRAFCTIDGKPQPSHDRGAYAILSNGGWMADNELNANEDPKVKAYDLHGYVKFRGYKNGNAHLTFLRLDLVDKLNHIIAKHYPNALPPSEGVDHG